MGSRKPCFSRFRPLMRGGCKGNFSAPEENPVHRTRRRRRRPGSVGLVGEKKNIECPSSRIFSKTRYGWSWVAPRKSRKASENVKFRDFFSRGPGACTPCRGPPLPSSRRKVHHFAGASEAGPRLLTRGNSSRSREFSRNISGIFQKFQKKFSTDRRDGA